MLRIATLALLALVASCIAAPISLAVATEDKVHGLDRPCVVTTFSTHTCSTNLTKLTGPTNGTSVCVTAMHPNAPSFVPPLSAERCDTIQELSLCPSHTQRCLP